MRAPLPGTERMPSNAALPSSGEWYDDYLDSDVDTGQVDQYDITASPNDFNVVTLYNYIDSGFVTIPSFQRHYVWSLPRASRFVESLILGLPVPQLFLYEEGNNEFLVIDGQQRLMTIYYFIKGRFPRTSQAATLRQMFEQYGQIPESTFADDEYFRDFRLQLSDYLPGRLNKLNRRTYEDLDEYRLAFDLRPVRTVVVKQNRTDSDISAVFEIFSRLNSGGVNLRPQEIRACIYHSPFYDSLAELNLNRLWRRLLAKPQPDPHMKDVEIMVRALAMLIDGERYAPSMTRFLNSFSKMCQGKTANEIEYLSNLFKSFLEKTIALPREVFINPATNRLDLALFEAVFTAACGDAYRATRMLSEHGMLNEASVSALGADVEFREASQSATTDRRNVVARLRLGREYIEAL